MTEERKVGRFGTFSGVFTPSVLTILGVIMFMRAGFVVGDSGIGYALLILALAKAITSLTTVSLSAIATNTEVGTGGNYFMISRTLGADIGGTVGLTLFLSQAVAIAWLASSRNGHTLKECRVSPCWPVLSPGSVASRSNRHHCIKRRWPPLWSQVSTSPT